MIEGGVWGGACDLAMSCDILVGSPTASFCMTPAKVGIPYNVTGVLHFMNVLGVNRMKEMFFTADPIGRTSISSQTRKSTQWRLRLTFAFPANSPSNGMR